MPHARIAALRNALGLEADGMAYYRQARDQASSNLGKQMFEFLRRSEEDHIKAIKHIYQSLGTEAHWPEEAIQWESHEEVRVSIFTEAMRELSEGKPLNSSDLEALRLAAEFERKGEDFYRERAEAVDDPFEKAFYQRLAEEEVAHLRAIEDAIELLENPDGFFLQREAGARSL